MQLWNGTGIKAKKNIKLFETLFFFPRINISSQKEETEREKVGNNIFQESIFLQVRRSSIIIYIESKNVILLYVQFLLYLYAGPIYESILKPTVELNTDFAKVLGSKKTAFTRTFRLKKNTIHSFTEIVV